MKVKKIEKSRFIGEYKLPKNKKAYLTVLRTRLRKAGKLAGIPASSSNSYLACLTE